MTLHTKSEKTTVPPIMSRSCSPPRSDSSRSARRKKMSEGGQKLIMIGAVVESQVSGKRNRTVSIRSLGFSRSTKEKRIYKYYELAPPAHTSYLSRTPRIYSCKFFLAGVNFFRFNAKFWQFTVGFAVITQKIGNLLCILGNITL